MNGSDEKSGRPRFVWPWFVLAGLVLGVALVFVWMSVAVKRVREMRASNPWSLPSSLTGGTSPGRTNSESKQDLLAGFRDLLSGGDAAAGRKVFFERPEANCAKCHKVGGEGGDTGPALDDVGARHDREFILEAILHPNLHVLTNYESVILVLTNGTACSGILKSEDAFKLDVNTPDEGLVQVRRDEIKLRQRGVSPMPEGLGAILPKPDLRNLLEYVSSLKTNAAAK